MRCHGAHQPHGGGRPAGFGYLAGPMHDENYKRIFAFPRVIEDLLRAFVPGDWLQEVNFATLDKLSTEYISDELLKRHGDNVWRMHLVGLNTATVKLLFDQNPAPRLVDELKHLFPGSEHVRAVGLSRADDLVVWEGAAGDSE